MKKLAFLTLAMALFQNGYAQNVNIESDKQKVIISEENGNKIEITTSKPSDLQPNSFVGSFDLQMESSKNTSVEKISIISSEEKTLLKPSFSDPKESETTIIFNHTDGTMTTLMFDKKKNQKTGMKMKMPKIIVTNAETVQNKGKNTPTKYTFTETNETQVIDGYLCKKYIYEDEKTTTVSWVTNDIKGNMGGIMNLVSIQNKGKNQEISNQISKVQGFMIESTSTNKTSGEITTIKIKNINLNTPEEKVFSTEGYQIQDLSNMNFFGQ